MKQIQQTPKILITTNGLEDIGRRLKVLVGTIEDKKKMDYVEVLEKFSDVMTQIEFRRMQMIKHYQKNKLNYYEKEACDKIREISEEYLSDFEFDLSCALVATSANSNMAQRKLIEILIEREKNSPSEERKNLLVETGAGSCKENRYRIGIYLKNNAKEFFERMEKNVREKMG